MNAVNKDSLKLHVEGDCSGFVFQFRDRKWLPAQRRWTFPQSWPRRRCLTPPTQAPSWVLTPRNERPRNCTWSPKLSWKADVSADAGLFILQQLMFGSAWVIVAPPWTYDSVCLFFFHSFHRASHQRHWCFPKARHWNWLRLPCSGRRRTATASESGPLSLEEFHAPEDISHCCCRPSARMCFPKSTSEPSCPTELRRRTAEWEPEMSSLALMEWWWKGARTSKCWTWWPTPPGMVKSCWLYAGRSSTEVRNANTPCLANCCYLLNVFKCFLDSPAQVNTHTFTGQRVLVSVSFQKQQRKKLRKWPRCCWTALPSYLGFPCPALSTTSLLILRCTAETMRVLASSSSPPRVNHRTAVSPRVLPCLFTCINSALKSAELAFTEMLICKKKQV